ncbi:uncharacterized protein [Clytia hemisphaerica]|uniref:EF-hand domain-containing protein n=1 Tax=Clytia hemisphaerica TaxID=252671 RepID=A0A7M5V7K9_9CNID
MTEFVGSEERIAEYKECFNLYDRDNDGLISIEQMKQVIRSLGQCPSDKELKELQQKLGKTKVTFPEFLDLMGKVMQKSRNPESEIFEGFRLYDQRQTGMISMKDLRHVMMRNGEKLSQPEFDYMLKEAGISKQSTNVKYADLARAFKQV